MTVVNGKRQRYQYQGSEYRGPATSDARFIDLGSSNHSFLLPTFLFWINTDWYRICDCCFNCNSFKVRKTAVEMHDKAVHEVNKVQQLILSYLKVRNSPNRLLWWYTFYLWVKRHCFWSVSMSILVILSSSWLNCFFMYGVWVKLTNYTLATVNYYWSVYRVWLRIRMIITRNQKQFYLWFSLEISRRFFRWTKVDKS